ncbi:MAG TPA: 30S ribosome-binding factor RbfA [Desulfomicrobiaceae bacterium]|nr:30S ribosome-binding factor RbfA [Desulfomicrobiaceae bacterium]
MQRATTRRSQRMSDQIMRELSRILVEEIQDPRLEMLSITGVRMNRDFSIAEVLYTHIKGQEAIPEIEKGLAKAKGYLRSQLGRRLTLRGVPDLRFTWDTFLEEMVYDHGVEQGS